MTPSGAHATVPRGRDQETLILSVTRRGPLNQATRSGITEAIRNSGWKGLGVGSTVFWGGAGLLAGTATFASVRGAPSAPGWIDSVVPPMVAGLLWVPLTLAIVAAARRYPPVDIGDGLRPQLPAAVLHAAGSVLVSFVLNLAFVAVTRPALLTSPALLAQAVGQLGLANLHFNAGAYWVMTLATVAWQSLTRPMAPDLPASVDQTLTVRTGTSTVRVRVSEIRWIEGSGDYVTLHLEDTEHLLSERLKSLEKRLDPEQFVRVHRSAIVNVSAVRRLKHLGHGDYEASLDGGGTVRVSRTRRSRLQEVLDAREVPGLSRQEE